MKNIEIKNIFKLCKFNLSTSRKQIIGWTVAIFAIMSLYMILFPAMQDLAQAKFDAMPKELLQFVGMQDMSDMSNYITYYSMIYTILLVAVSIFSASFSAKLITKEESTKSIEFLNSLAVSRSEIYISKYCTSLVAITIVILFATLSAIVCGFIGGGETFVLSDIIASVKITSFTAYLFGGIALMLAGISTKVGSGAIVSSVVVASYMLGYLGQLLEDKGDVLLYFSPFVTLNVQDAVLLTDRLVLSLSIYFIVYIIALVVGGVYYNKRDMQL